MRRTIFNFNQQRAIELGLSVNDLLLLNYIQLANTSHKMEHIEKDGISYVFLSHSKIHEDIPILGYTEGSLKNKLAQLKKQGIIESTTVQKMRGSKSYYTITDNALDTLFEEYKEDDGVISKLPQGSSENDVRGNLKVTPNIYLVDNKLEDKENIILKNNTDQGLPLVNNDIVNTPLVNNKRKIPNININDDVQAKSFSDDLDKPKKKKLNLYQKVMLEIDTRYSNDKDLTAALKDYAAVRLAIKEKPIKGIGQWKAILNTLDGLNGDKVAIVHRATERGWAAFFEISDYTYNKRGGTGYANSGGVTDYSVFGETEKMNTARPETVEGGDFSGQVF